MFGPSDGARSGSSCVSMKTPATPSDTAARAITGGRIGRHHRDRGVWRPADDGRNGLYLGQEYPLDAAVVDLGLPDLPGIDRPDLMKRLFEAEASWLAG